MMSTDCLIYYLLSERLWLFKVGIGFFGSYQLPKPWLCVPANTIYVSFGDAVHSLARQNQKRAFCKKIQYACAYNYCNDLQERLQSGFC